MSDINGPKQHWVAYDSGPVFTDYVAESVNEPHYCEFGACSYVFNVTSLALVDKTVPEHYRRADTGNLPSIAKRIQDIDMTRVTNRIQCARMCDKVLTRVFVPSKAHYYRLPHARR